MSPATASNSRVCSADVAQLELTIAEATGAIAGLQAEEHAQEKAIVAYEAQRDRADEERARLARKAEVIALERRTAEEERAALESETREADASIIRLESEQRAAEERLGDAQRTLADARDTAGALGAQAAEARATHAALVERAAALAAEVLRLEEGARELELRIGAHHAELQQTHTRRESLLKAIVDGQRTLDEDIQTLVGKRDELRAADESAAALRASVDAQDSSFARRGEPSRPFAARPPISRSSARLRRAT